MKLYVCGFMFNEDRSRVLLIKKMKPAWQRGRINGVGGKIEPGETPEQAMVREFKEEVGIQHEDWERFVTLRNDDVAYRLDFFRTVGPLGEARKMEEEAPVVLAINELYSSEVIPNLRWLIPLALDEALAVPIEIEDVGKN